MRKGSSEIIEGPLSCSEDDLAGVIELVDGVMREGSDRSVLTDYPLVYDEKNLGNIMIVRSGGRVVSVVPFIPRPARMGGACFNVGIISPTATHPEHRRRGFALQCLRKCIEKMERTGTDISVLWTRVPTFRFYEHADYAAVKRIFFIYRCGGKDAILFENWGESIREYDPESREYLEDIRSMHEAGACVIQRRAEEYPRVFSLPGMKTYLALEDGAPGAYLTLSRAAHRPGVVEAGGGERALETLMNFVLSGASGEIVVHDYPVDTVLGRLMRRRMPGRREIAEKHMMARINDVSSFLRKISPCLRRGVDSGGFSVGLKETGETVSVEFLPGGIETGSRRLPGHAEVSRGELASIVFGPHEERPVRIPAPLRDYFPVYLPIRQLDHS